VDGSRRRASCRSLGDGDVGLWVDYEDRLEAKAIPTARWDKHLKCWRIRSVFRDEAEDLVHDLNDRHVTTRERRAAPVDLSRAMTEMFAALPSELRRPVHRALARVLHPDMGGDHESMQALNAAAEVLS
jgi:hypothetical protein